MDYINYRKVPQLFCFFTPLPKIVFYLCLQKSNIPVELNNALMVMLSYLYTHGVMANAALNLLHKYRKATRHMKHAYLRGRCL